MFFCLLTIISTQFLFAQKTYIWCGVLIDGISNEPKKEMTIVIEKNKIVAGFYSPGSNSHFISILPVIQEQCLSQNAQIQF